MVNKHKILIVEDDANTQILYKALFNQKYDYYMCDNVSSAKKYLQENGIVKLILLDLSLKGDDDGLALANYIRSSGKWGEITILAVTAHAFAFDKERCLEAGCDEILIKPIRGNTLVNHINRILGI